MTSRIFIKYRSAILYGISLAALLFLLKWLEFKFLITNHAFEVYIGFIAIIFTSLGIWLALKLFKPAIKTTVKTVIVEKKVYMERHEIAYGEKNNAEAKRLGLSQRELEVLELMSAGLSNQEIADKLFVSLNTIKTHSAKIFEKMDVKRRTQAVEMAKRLHIIW